MILAKLLMPAFARASAFAARFVRPEIVFIGDSITEFWSIEDRWVFRPTRLNAGISGQTTEQMRARFAADVVARHPRAVHVMGGTNDLWFGAPGEAAAVSLANIGAMVEMAQAAGIAVILAPPPPIARRAEELFAHLDCAAALREGVTALAREKGCRLVDYADVLIRDGDFVPAFTTDGVHLTHAGYRAMRRPAEAAIRKPSR